MRMLPMRIMCETVEVIRPNAVESRGTVEKSWDGAETHIVSGVSVQEKTGQSDLNGRDAATATATMYAQSGADIMRGDRVVAHGRTWDVVGEPLSVGVGRSISYTSCSLQSWEG